VTVMRSLGPPTLQAAMPVAYFCKRASYYYKGDGDCGKLAGAGGKAPPPVMQVVRDRGVTTNHGRRLVLPLLGRDASRARRPCCHC
jgi:hypothetical protein